MAPPVWMAVPVWMAGYATVTNLMVWPPPQINMAYFKFKNQFKALQVKYTPLKGSPLSINKMYVSMDLKV